MDETRGRETTARLMHAVNGVKERAAGAVDMLEQGWERAGDWREPVARYPVAALVIVGIAGFVIGRQIMSLVDMRAPAAPAAFWRAAPTEGRAAVDRIIDGAAATLATGVLAPAMSGLRKLVDTGRARLDEVRTAARR